jgi:DNA primase
MQNNWVDFNSIKAVVTMEMILGRYGVNWLRKNGEELRGRCPIHQGEGQSTFHASVTKNAFNCFSCKARGNVLDFVAAMEKCSVRAAGAKLMEWFSISVTPEPDGKKTAAKEDRGAGEPVPVNKPLAFQLKGIDHEHPYLKARGITTETARTFGVGYFPGKGSMSGRVVIPIQDERGELVAYAGRSIDDSEPKYKLPAAFHKSAELYNLHRVGESDRIIAVEGFFDCMKVHQAGFPSVVALMGCTMSQQQHMLLLRFPTAVLMLDGDGAGRTAAKEIAGRLMYSHYVKAVSLVQNIQPDQLSIQDLQQVLASV